MPETPPAARGADVSVLEGFLAPRRLPRCPEVGQAAAHVLTLTVIINY
jgi:hypothetical protein